LPEREQRFLTTRTMRAVVISDDSHPNMKFEIFERLNRGSLILNEQELRNSLYRGPFNRMLRELVKQAAFRSLIGTKSPRKRMVDEEFCLRFFALHDDIVGYRPPLKKFLNDYMRSVQNADPETLDELREDFNSAVARVNACLHDRAFRMTDARGAVVERAPNRALFDAQMLAFSWARDDDLAQHRSAIIREFGRLYSDNDFVDSISLATGDRVRTRLRVRRALEALVEAGVEVEAPNIPA